MAELTLAATLENLETVIAFVDGELEKANCPIKTQMQIDVAVEELFVNIASYAYPSGEGSALIRLETDAEAGNVEITFEDSGIPYDPVAKADPDVSLPAEKRQIGGLGIFMVKKTMDSMRYERRDGRNILTITKNM